MSQTLSDLVKSLRERRGSMPSQDSTSEQLKRVRALLRKHNITDPRHAVMVANAAGDYDAADVLKAGLTAA